MKHNYLLLIGIVAGIVLLGSLSGMFAQGEFFAYSGINAMLWYNGLQKLIEVPGFLFGVVWTILYVLMGVSLYLIVVSDDKRKAIKQERRRAIGWFLAQFGLNLLWSLLFFMLRMPLVALIEMVLMLGAIVMYMIPARRVSKASMWLMVPYVAWVLFAMVLNAGIVLLN